MTEQMHVSSISLRRISFEKCYSSSRNSIAEEFYNPCLENSIRYERAAGYFRSSVFSLCNSAITKFAIRGGKIRLICSPSMAPEDIDAIKAGYDLRERIGEVLLAEIESILNDSKGKPVVEFLATLIGINCLDIKIALRRNMLGLFHDKVGIFTDPMEDSVCFIGSNNETINGWGENGNHESFDVFCSWSNDYERVNIHRQIFECLWNGEEPGLQVITLPEMVIQSLSPLINHSGIQAAYSKAELLIPKNELSLFPHQIDAIRQWNDAGCKGILEHATGSGKTITALMAIKDKLINGNPIIILVPSELLLDQWYAEIQKQMRGINVKILRAGAGYDDWRNYYAVEGYTSPNGEPRIILATIQTCSSEKFLKRVNIGDHLVVVIDEVHRVGSPKYSRVLDIEAGSRLGLSATPIRYGDEIGTEKILDYFGGVLQPPFTIGDAIKVGRLCKYTYHIHPVALEESEQVAWKDLTTKISRLFAKLKASTKESSHLRSILKNLLIQRSRIVKQATNKIALSVQVIKDFYQPGQRWLIYCDSQNQLEQVMQEISSAGFENDEYISNMPGDQQSTLAHFRRMSGIIVAIKCLDEGVDIPSIDHALILASSKNPREFIQRRGRVLRRSPGKYFAEIHDSIVLPSPDCHDSSGSAFLKNELSRALEFSKTATNDFAYHQLCNIADMYDVDINELGMETKLTPIEEASDD